MIPIEVEASINTQISSFIGFERMIGFDNNHGPFIQERIYFSGLQYEAKASAKLSFFGKKIFEKDKEDKGNLIPHFDLKSDRMYIMKLFK